MGTRLFAREVEIYEGEQLLLVARVETAGGTPLVIADVSSVGVSFFQMPSSTPATAVYVDGPLDPAVIYFDTLQHDDAENLLGDDGGYNFRYELDSSTFLLRGGNTYRVQAVSTVGSSSYVMVYDVKVLEVL
jgi:hypothetical protein